MTRDRKLLALVLTTVGIVLSACCSYAKDNGGETADLSYIIDQAKDGFAGLRGRAWDKKWGDIWSSSIDLTGAEGCTVDWTKKGKFGPVSSPYFSCVMLITSREADAQREYLRLIDLAVSREPNWKQVYEPPSHKDNNRGLIELGGMEGKRVKREFHVSYDKHDQGKTARQYFVTLNVFSDMSVEEAVEAVEANHKNMAAFVKEDVQEFVKAAADGFEAYKSGEPTTLKGGGKAWVSSRKPILAKSCNVQEQNTTNMYLCVLSSSHHKFEVENGYLELIADVIAALPEGWFTTSNPPFGDAVASKRFSSSSGMTGDIWIDFDPSTKEYTLNYLIRSNPKHPH